MTTITNTDLICSSDEELDEIAAEALRIRAEREPNKSAWIATRLLSPEDPASIKPHPNPLKVAWGLARKGESAEESREITGAKNDYKCIGRDGEKKTSARKAAASRENGKKGGRPRKKPLSTSGE